MSCTLDSQKVDEFYDHVGAHLRGVVKVLKPIIEINKILNECRVSKSAGHSTRGKITETNMKLPYYTPQKMKSEKTTSSGGQRRLYECTGDFSERKLNSDNSCNRSINKSIHKSLLEASNNTAFISTYSISKKEINYSKKSTTHLSTSIEHKSYERSQATLSNIHKEHLKNCSICGIDINKVKVLALAPCKHSFCYSCISRIDLNSCPKCWKSFKREAIKNITQ